MTGGLEGSDDAGRVPVGVGGGADTVPIRQAAALLGVHQNTVRQRVKSGVYKAEKVDTKHGPTWLIDRASLSSHASAKEPEHLAAGPYDEPSQGTGQPQIGDNQEPVVKPRWRRWVFAPFRLLAWPWVRFYNWLGSETNSAKFAVRISEVAALIALSIAAGNWIFTIDDRRLEREYGAWQVIDAAAGTETSKARIIALELLNKSDARLDRLDLASADLRYIVLPEAFLWGTDLRRADLYESHLNWAVLIDANLNGAKLTRADLQGSDLFRAELNRAVLIDADLDDTHLSEADLDQSKLKGAQLRYADLTGAKLRDADLSGANLSGAKGITNEQLDQQAAFLEGAIMPNGQKYEDWLKDREKRQQDE
jgi:uncharacterized protein YjbI with pentapeptide repeats